MQGLMQDHPLTLPHIFQRAEKLFPNKQIVTAMKRYNYLVVDSVSAKGEKLRNPAGEAGFH